MNRLTNLLFAARGLASGEIQYHIDRALFLVRREYHRNNLRFTKER